MSTRAVVVGAGMAGLATSILLARDGFAVTVLEKNSRVGGRAGLLEVDGFRFDTGPSWYLMPSVFDHFFELAGTSTAEQLDLRMLDPGYRVFPEPSGAGPASDPISIPYGQDAVRRLVADLEPDALPAFDNYLETARRAMDMAEDAFLYNTFRNPVSLVGERVRRELPDLLTWLTTPLEKFVEESFTHPLLRQILAYQAVFLGTDPRRAPAIYHLMSRMDLVEGVQYPMGGFTAVVDALHGLAVEAGVEFVLDAEVTGIAVSHGWSRGVHWRDAAGEPHFEDVEVVVSAADLHHTETQLLPARYRSYPERVWKKTDSGPGAVLVMLGVTGELPALPHHSLLLTKEWGENFDAIFGEGVALPDPVSIYVCKPSATDPEVAPEGHENLFLLIPVKGDASIGGGGADGAGDAEVERIADLAIAQLAEWTVAPDLADRIVVRSTLGPADFVRDYNSWRGGILGPSHELAQSAMLRAGNASPKVKGLYYAGATVNPGVGVPMCLISAELVLKHVRGDRSPGPLGVERR
ncbi:phytoene desaturase family protein [Pseudoclavibacter helvolus]|uniref:Phytoene desaturase n=1 Tax=Pseudoclavibacter helvolus TaxID=255205 RepID=A0A7W4YEN5_9MICO|nr:phytoene desaturase family protein [Pseudoclavibacter helvolus]MBB2956045.1 phytoene desaturase [Pseudoclavibacter helvolus]